MSTSIYVGYNDNGEYGPVQVVINSRDQRGEILRFRDDNGNQAHIMLSSAEMRRLIGDLVVEYGYHHPLMEGDA
jgi:hypothetical protein